MLQKVINLKKIEIKSFCKKKFFVVFESLFLVNFFFAFPSQIISKIPISYLFFILKVKYFKC